MAMACFKVCDANGLARGGQGSKNSIVVIRLSLLIGKFFCEVIGEKMFQYICSNNY